MMGFIDVWKKFYVFEQFGYNTIGQGVLSKNELFKAMEQGVLSPDTFSPWLLNKIFQNQSPGEFIGFDFKSFYVMLMANTMAFEFATINPRRGP